MPEEMENEVGFFSLSELASMDTTALPALTSLIPAAGVYFMRGEDVKGGENQSQDESKPNLFYFNFVGEILEAKLVDKSIDPETLVGRKLTDNFTLWPNQFKELLGLLKGRYKTVGLVYDGPRLGGVDGQEPGWLDNWVGHEYHVKISHYTDKGGNVRARFTYMKPQNDEAGE